MGFGDEIIAAGLARGAAKNGKLVAFGDGTRVIWSEQAHQIFQNNPNVVRPDADDLNHVRWVRYYRGNRTYGKVVGPRWKFRDWEPPPGEIFFSEEEKLFGLTAQKIGWPFVVVEPRVKVLGATAGPNKQWPVERYAEVAKYLTDRDMRVVQFVPPNRTKILPDVEAIVTPNFRSALAVLSRAVLYIGPEGGLHHGAAAVNTDAVVIFGGFNSPKSTGYKGHENIAVGEPCGSVGRCLHCKEAMESISVEQVLGAAGRLLGNAVVRGHI